MSFGCNFWSYGCEENPGSCYRSGTRSSGCLRQYSKSFALKTQVATIMKSSAKSFQLRHIHVQRQIGTNYCALFAMAFATSLCLHRDPTTESYLQASMRQHFMACYGNQKISISQFRSSSKTIGRQKIIHVQRVDIFCICRLAWNSKENENFCCLFHVCNIRTIYGLP